jgi:hypothetical protein
MDRDQELIARSIARLEASAELLAKPIHRLPPWRAASGEPANPDDPALQGAVAVRVIARAARLMAGHGASKL